MALTSHRCLRPQDDFFCHAHNRDGLVGVVFVDKEYPVRSAFCVVNKVRSDELYLKWHALRHIAPCTGARLPQLQQW